MLSAEPVGHSVQLSAQQQLQLLADETRRRKSRPRTNLVASASRMVATRDRGSTSISVPLSTPSSPFRSPSSSLSASSAAFPSFFSLSTTHASGSSAPGSLAPLLVSGSTFAGGGQRAGEAALWEKQPHGQQSSPPGRSIPTVGGDDISDGDGGEDEGTDVVGGLSTRHQLQVAAADFAAVHHRLQKQIRGVVAALDRAERRLVRLAAKSAHGPMSSAASSCFASSSSGSALSNAISVSSDSLLAAAATSLSSSTSNVVAPRTIETETAPPPHANRHSTPVSASPATLVSVSAPTNRPVTEASVVPAPAFTTLSQILQALTSAASTPPTATLLAPVDPETQKASSPETSPLTFESKKAEPPVAVAVVSQDASRELPSITRRVAGARVLSATSISRQRSVASDTASDVTAADTVGAKRVLAVAEADEKSRVPILTVSIATPGQPSSSPPTKSAKLSAQSRASTAPAVSARQQPAASEAVLRDAVVVAAPKAAASTLAIRTSVPPRKPLVAFVGAEASTAKSSVVLAATEQCSLSRKRAFSPPLPATTTAGAKKYPARATSASTTSDDAVGGDDGGGGGGDDGGDGGDGGDDGGDSGKSEEPLEEADEEAEDGKEESNGPTVDSASSERSRNVRRRRHRSPSLSPLTPCSPPDPYTDLLPPTPPERVKLARLEQAHRLRRQQRR